jgi:hypothetical protein
MQKDVQITVIEIEGACLGIGKKIFTGKTAATGRTRTRMRFSKEVKASDCLASV